MRAILSRETIDEAIDEARFQLAPFNPQELAVSVDRLLTFARTYAIQTDRNGLVETYRDGCKGMSRRALREGVEMVLRASTDTFRLPLPGAVWDIIRDETAKWEAQLRALEEVRRQMNVRPTTSLPKPEDVPVSPEYVRETQDITARTLAALKTKSAQVKIW